MSGHQKGHRDEVIISVLGLAATLFAIGYELGKDIHDHHDKTQK